MLRIAFSGSLRLPVKYIIYNLRMGYFFLKLKLQEVLCNRVDIVIRISRVICIEIYINDEIPPIKDVAFFDSTLY